MKHSMKKQRAARVRGVFPYLVVYDYSAGRPNRYTVFILTAEDPVTIGRELSRRDARRLIEAYETTAVVCRLVYFGGRRQALSFRRTMTAQRRRTRV